MNILKLLNTQKTVFTVQQIGQILGIQNMNVLRVQLTRRGKQGLLKPLHYGVWAFPHYSQEELANTLKTPSYISLETVLYKE
jgi:predicted transcriptional regulator of viral defense system